jgi:hypothetical protein
MYRYERDHLNGWAPLQPSGLGFSLRPPAWLRNLVTGAQKTASQAGTIVNAANQSTLPQTQMGTPANLNLTVAGGDGDMTMPLIIGASILGLLIVSKGFK